MKRLSDVDFAEFQIRTLLVTYADTQLKLMQDGFDLWASNIRRRYRIRSKRFDIDRRTGEILEKAGSSSTDSTNGSFTASSAD